MTGAGGPCRVVVPYTSTEHLGAIQAALEPSGADWCMVEIDHDDPGAYGRLMGFVWDLSGDLIVCEHDITPTVDQVRRMVACGHRWCGHGYWHGDRWCVRGLGLTRFSAALRKEWPGLMREAAVIQDDRPRWCPWWSLDSRLAIKLVGVGERWLEHGGGVTHRGIAPTRRVS